MLGYSCGMREINNLNARYSFLHLGKKCGRLLAGVKGHLWDEARRDAAASLDLVRAGEGENLSLSSIYTILHDMLSRLQGVAEVAASGLMEKLWPAFRRLYQGLTFGNMGNKGERGTARGDDGGDAEFINQLIELYWILDEGSKMAAEANLHLAVRQVRGCAAGCGATSPSPSCSPTASCRCSSPSAGTSCSSCSATKNQLERDYDQLAQHHDGDGRLDEHLKCNLNEARTWNAHGMPRQRLRRSEKVPLPFLPHLATLAPSPP